MALTKITKTGITDASVERAKIGADAVDATKIADDSISEEHLDVTAITGNTELSAVAADDDVLLVYDTSANAIKKIQRSNIALQAPTVSSISPSNATTGDGTGNHTIVITGTRFDGTATASFINSSGTTINADTSTRNSATQITAVIAKSSLPNSGEPYDVKVSNGNGLNTTLDNALNIDAQPVYTTTAGSLGTVSGGSAISTIDIVASDPESAGNVTFEFQSGSLPAGLSSATVNENGVSKFRITGTPTNPTATTTSNFVLRAVDAASNTSSRSFSITVNRTFSQTSFTSSGTFAVPSGTSSLDAVLVVAGGGGGGTDHGGGGGAGGLVFMPGYPVTPGGTITVTVGCGGISGQNSDPAPFPGGGGKDGRSGQDSVFGAPGDPGKHPSGDVLTAKGGGGGGGGPVSQTDATEKITGQAGGSSGGAGGHAAGPGSSRPAYGATQPTQSGDSGAYGFGGGGGTAHYSATGLYSGGGGGAGAGGNPGVHPTNEGDGGIGKAYTIADGTSPVYYAGGGGGTHYCGGACTPGKGQGGQGGGGSSVSNNPAPTGSGTANRGGGAGAGNPSPTGGKGIVIVRY